MTSLRLFAMAYPVTALGPGLRVALWVTGCGRDCPGCISPEMQPADAGRIVPVDRLVHRILSIPAPLSGMTISGGEPFDQAGALTVLLTQIKNARPDWNVIAYSGYTLAEIRQDSGRAGLAEMVDILVDGPYRRELPPVHPLAGSANQQVHYLSPKGVALRDAVEQLTMGAMDFGMSADGRTDMVIGVTREEQRGRFMNPCGGATKETC